MNTPMQNGKEPIHLAAQNGHANAIDALHAAGANVDTTTPDGWTALMIAASRGHTEALEALIDAPATINAMNMEGNTALTLATCAHHLTTVVTLIINGAKTKIEKIQEQAGLEPLNNTDPVRLPPRGLEIIHRAYQKREAKIQATIQRIPAAVIKLIARFDCDPAFSYLTPNILEQLQESIPRLSALTAKNLVTNTSSNLDSDNKETKVTSDELYFGKQIYKFPKLSTAQLNLLVRNGAEIIGDLPGDIGIQIAIESSTLHSNDDLTEKTGIQQAMLAKLNLNAAQLSYLKTKIPMITIESANQRYWCITAPKTDFDKVIKVCCHFDQISVTPDSSKQETKGFNEVLIFSHTPNASSCLATHSMPPLVAKSEETKAASDNASPANKKKQLSLIIKQGTKIIGDVLDGFGMYGMQIAIDPEKYKWLKRLREKTARHRTT